MAVLEKVILEVSFILFHFVLREGDSGMGAGRKPQNQEGNCCFMADIEPNSLFCFVFFKSQIQINTYLGIVMTKFYSL